MANSRFEVARHAEHDHILSLRNYIVVRVDGHSFHRFTQLHEFTKPNDARSLNLMNHAAHCVMSQFSDINLAFGSSDEFSFLLRRSYSLYGRRESKLISLLVSQFTGAYIYHWSKFFNIPLQYVPTFDARPVLYAEEAQVKEYFSWRQADAHINNLYNTTFWALQQTLPVRRGTNHVQEEEGLMTAREAEQRLIKTLAKDKNEILWQRGINYNNEPEMYKKGSILLYEDVDRPTDTLASLVTADEADNMPDHDSSSSSSKPESNGSIKRRERRRRKVGVSVLHVDLIQDAFWQQHPDILKS